MDFQYKAPPIVARYLRSDAHMRVIMGPQGCLPADTEFLSSVGWVRMDAYESGMQVAQWFPDGRVEFTAPFDYIVQPASDFIEFDSGSLVMQLSPEHRVPHQSWNGSFAVCTAGQMEKKPSRRLIPTTFRVANQRLTNHVPDALLRFAVMMHADGHYPRGRRACVCVRKSRKIKRVREILNALSVVFEERVYPQRPTETQFWFVPPYTGKHFDSVFWWSLSPLQLRVVLQECMHWDGLHDHAERVFYTAHKCDADFIQYAAHATGRRASIKRVDYPDNSQWKPSFQVHIRVDDNAKNRAYVREHTKIKRIPSLDGRQYCFTVETGFFVARCRDTVFVTGNSGKSSGSCIELLRRSISRKPDSDGVRRAKWVVVRNTVPMLRDTTIPTFLQWFPHGALGAWHATDKFYHFKFGDVDAQVLFRALDDNNDVAKLLSSEYTGCYFNEFREIDPVIYEAMTKRVGRWKTDPTWTQQDMDDTWYGIWGDTNPPQVGSWLHQQMEKYIDNDWDIFKQPSGRSPDAENRDHLRSDYYDAKGLSEEYVRVMIDGEYGYDQSGLPVFGKTFTPAWHVSADPLRPLFGAESPLLLGIDAGLTPAAILGQLDYRGRLLVLGECYVEPGESMGMERFLTTRLLPYIQRRFPQAGKGYVTGDPAINHRGQGNEVTPFDFLIRYFHVALAFTDKLPARLNAAEMWFAGQVDGKPKIVLDGANTPKLQAALAHNYRFAKKKSTGSVHDEIRDTPEKNHPWSDLADAFMYLCMHSGGGAGAINQQPARKIEVVSARGWT